MSALIQLDHHRVVCTSRVMVKCYYVHGLTIQFLPLCTTCNARWIGIPFFPDPLTLFMLCSVTLKTYVIMIQDIIH